MSTPPAQKPARDAAAVGERRSNQEKMRTGVLLALAVLATLFAVLNVKEVKVNWVFGSGHAPLIVVIVISLLAGIVLSYLAERLNRKRH
jgi:uncharacterized integral membrane protein